MKFKNVTKKDVWLIVLVSLSFVCNFFIFNQLDLIMHNQNELGISAGEVLWFFLLFGLLVLVVLAVILLLLCNFCKVAYKILLCLLFGYTVATYAQVLFFNGNSMNAMDGSAVFTGVSIFGIVFNCILFFVILGLPTFFMFFFRNRQELIRKIFLLVCVVILGMQVVGLITTSAGIKKLDENAKFYYFSVDDYLQVSKNENIIVFVMDRLATPFVEDVFEEWGDEATEIFNGFTWYKNNISEYRQTFPSVSTMLTGANVKFEKAQSQTEFLPYVWENNTVFKALRKNNYRINGLLDSNSTYYNIDDVAPYFDNIKTATKAETKIHYDQVLGNTTGIAAMRNLPFAFKQLIPVHDYANLTNLFVDLSGCDGYFPKATNPESDLFYYDALQDTQLTANREQNTFSLVHLNSVHGPFRYDENLNKKISFSFTDSRQAYGSMKILNEYFTQLKNMYDDEGNNLFDKSTIIVMADHGADDSGCDDDPVSGLAYASLFIKRAGETADVPMYTNETAQMSTRNFAATILELLGEEHDDNSYFDIDPEPKTNTDTELEQERYFYFISWKGWKGDFQSTATLDWTATINGDAYDENNWNITY